LPASIFFRLSEDMFCMGTPASLKRFTVLPYAVKIGASFIVGIRFKALFSKLLQRVPVAPKACALALQNVIKPNIQRFVGNLFGIQLTPGSGRRIAQIGKGLFTLLDMRLVQLSW
jgi:hypothetical protein